jgi:hypothetical protein
MMKDKEAEKESTKLYVQAKSGEDYSAVFWGKWDVNRSISKKAQRIKFTRSDESKNPFFQGRNRGHKNPDLDEDKVKDVIFGNQFKLVLYNDGTLYSWGISAKG